MATKFAPLILPTQLHPLPNNYAQRIKQFRVEGDFTTQHRLNRFLDFIDLEKVDHEDSKMRLFALNFSEDVNKWFNGLQDNSIVAFQTFENAFMRK